MRHARESIRLGFMPLTDAAIPVVAAHCGFAAEQGLEIELVRETSWANVRDRLAIGHFDAAHLLAPLPIAAALGLSPFDAPLIAPMTLGTGGNAVTVSEALWRAMAQAAPMLAVADPASVGAALVRALAIRKSRGEPPPVLAVVHPFSSHNYELRYWLAASGIDPERDVAIAILPPPYLPDALAAGRIDGYCVGEPWNSRAALAGIGRIVLTKQAIWPGSPDKVLALRADWAEARGELAGRLVAAMLKSAAWCADPANRVALAALIAGEDVLGVPADEVRPALAGLMPMADGERAVPGMLDLAAGATVPRLGHAAFFLSQMRRWGQAHLPGASAEAGALARLARVFDTGLHRGAAERLGLTVAPPEPPLAALPPGEHSPGLFDAAAG